MRPVAVVLKLNPTGGVAFLEVDGVDISGVTVGVGLQAVDGAPTRLHVQLRPGADIGALEGDADVTIQRGEGDFSTAVPEFLSHIDASELERQALARLEYGGDTNPTAAMLALLSEWAQGRG